MDVLLWGFSFAAAVGAVVIGWIVAQVLALTVDALVDEPAAPRAERVRVGVVIVLAVAALVVASGVIYDVLFVP